MNPQDIVRECEIGGIYSTKCSVENHCDQG